MKNFVLFRYLTAVLLVAGLLAGQMAMAQVDPGGTPSGNGVDPTFISQEDIKNPSCQDLGFDFGFKIETPDGGIFPNGTFFFTTTDGILTGTTPPDPNNSITIENSDGLYFDWTSTLGIDLVIVKGGNDANAYYYIPEEDGDTGLHSPVKPDGTPYGISHVEVCYDYELTIEKTAETSYTREYLWDITKTVDPDEWHLFKGDQGTSLYTVSVDKTGFEDMNFAVNGTVTIANNTPFDATITGISDYVDGIMVTPTCGVTFPYTLEAGDVLECEYYTELPDKTDRTNTVTVTTSGTVGGGTATADVTFGEPTSYMNATVDVSDTNGQSWSTSDDASWSYEKTFSCDSDEGSHDNTATVYLQGGDKTASATVDVYCYDLTVTKDASTSLTRTWNWTIDKTVVPTVLNMFTGDVGTADYTVTVDKVNYTDSEWAVTGNITITNSNPYRAADLTEVTDVISPDIAAGVSCPSLSIPAGGSLTCTYSKENLPDGSTRTNTATATLQNYSYASNGTPTETGTIDFSGTATVNFSNAEITEVNASIDVTDTNGQSWSASDDASWSYSQDFTCDSDEGSHTNTATITQTGQSDDASVTVNCYAPQVSKTANTSLNRYYEWTIDKVADQSALTLSTGQQFLVNYDVTVGATFMDGDWKVSGIISVYNPAPIAATINSVSDVVSGVGTIDVNCEVTFPYTMAPGETFTCTYTADLGGAVSGTNTATATLQNTPGGTTDFSGDKNFDFSDPAITLIDECIDVSDTYAGSLGEVCYDDVLPKIFEYSRWIGPYDVCGAYEVYNVASFVSNDTPLEGSDSWTITIDVPCGGCTLTPGYWKTHSINGPAPYDDTWAYFDPDGDGIYATFFLSGQSWYEVLWTPPAGGNAYYILASAYIAAKLNFLNEASSTPEVDAAFAWATEFFETYGPSPKPSGQLRKDAIAAAEILDAYNNGLAENGPVHCDEEETYSSTMSAMTTATDQLLAANGYRLGQNIPNPFTGVTTIPFVLPEDTHVRITLFNYNGQQITVLLDGDYTAGEHHLEWSTPADLSPGMYFYRMETPAVTLTRKMNVMR